MTNSRLKGTLQVAYVASDFTTTSTTLVDVTGAVLTLKNNSGVSLFTMSADTQGSTSQLLYYAVVETTTVKTTMIQTSTGADHSILSQHYPFKNSGQAIKMQAKTSTGTLTAFGDGALETMVCTIET